MFFGNINSAFERKLFFLVFSHRLKIWGQKSHGEKYDCYTKLFWETFLVSFAVALKQSKQTISVIRVNQKYKGFLLPPNQPTIQPTNQHLLLSIHCTLRALAQFSLVWIRSKNNSIESRNSFTVFKCVDKKWLCCQTWIVFAWTTNNRQILDTGRQSSYMT